MKCAWVLLFFFLASRPWIEVGGLTGTWVLATSAGARLSGNCLLWGRMQPVRLLLGWP